MKNQPRNFRFWTFHNDGWIKLTLRPGQKLTWHRFGACEEGFSHTIEVCELAADGSCCTEHSYFEGRDCDGHISRHYSAAFDLLTGSYVPSFNNDRFNGQIIYRPVFIEFDASQRDYTAEAMNY